MISKKKWKRIGTTPPPKHVDFWGYDTIHSAVHNCMWDGEDVDDNGNPFPKCDGVNGNDYSIEYWMEMEKTPDPPNVEETTS